ncbi:MAG TPA: aldehyde dehydrogenase family protein [Solirubrobacterales bacterium]|nr:aldehyde dehydrogenase family protein [Solirubrobacterales bacterium]
MYKNDASGRVAARTYLNDQDLLGMVAQAGGETIPTADPYTGEVIAEIPSTKPSRIAEVVSTSRATLESWRSSLIEERVALLRRMADLIDDSYDELAAIESIDVGKLYAGTRGWDVGNARDVLRFYADHGPEYLERSEEYERGRSFRQPLGAIAALSPWNAPLAVGTWKVAPALLAGCTVVLKAPERAPLSTLALTRLAEQADAPSGAVQVVAGLGSEVGTALVEASGLDGISFTGGTSVASSIIAASAENLPRMVLELGGKNANVVFADADLDEAVAGTVTAIFDVAGQNCCAGSRTIVESSIREEFIERLVAATGEIVVGDQFDEATTMAPQIDSRHAATVLQAIEKAQQEGAKLLCGGSVRGPNETCLEPTLIVPLSLDQEIWNEEIFGPVGCIAEFDGIEEAIEMANATEYGLSASVWSSDPAKLERFAAESEVGVCWTNTFGLFDIGVPWGGVKRSGYGRELALSTLDEFTRVKTVY